jgi:hypothetical protein
MVGGMSIKGIFPTGQSLKEKKVLLASLALFVISTVFLAYSFTVSWNAQATVNVYSPSLDLKVYWDSACTNPVTSIDFGNVQKSTSKTVTMYVRNEGNGSVVVYWNSTCPLVTSHIPEIWGYISGSTYYNMNGTSISMGQVFQTLYRITPDSDCPSGQYSWTLSLGAQPV